MSSRYDIAVIGGSFDGLVAAAYLARAGKSVIVIEPSDRVGGVVSTDEVAPGCRAPVAFSTFELLHPKVVAELELGDHGLRLLGGDGVFQPASEGPALHLDPERGSVGGQIAAWSARDGEAFERFESFHRKVAAALAPAFENRLPAPAPSGLGGVVDLLGLAWRLRRLGTRDLPEALRQLPMPIKDVLDDWFETEHLKAALAAPALTASWLAPRSAGSAFGLLYHRPAWTAGPVTPARFVQGGPDRLTEAVASTFKASGGSIRTSCPVAAVSVHAGRAGGVVLESGETILAANVVSSLDPATTLLDLVPPEWLDPDMTRAAASVRGRGSVALVRYVVDRLPAFGGAPEGDRHLSGRIQIGDRLDTFERAFDSAQRGRLPESPCIDLTVPSVVDPSIAATGRHVVSAWTQYVPRVLAEGDWSTRGDELADTVTASVEALAPGFEASVVARDVVTPEAYETRFGLRGGCLYQVDLSLDQLLHLRPMAGWYDYDTPIEGLYLCGPGSHPGGGVTGLPGRLAAQRVARAVRS